MIIKGKPLSPFFFKCGALLIGWFLKRRFHKLVVRPIDIKPGYSYLLMCNHFSFLDGTLAYYLCSKALWKDDGMKRLHIMMVKKQLQQRGYMKLCGGFSVDPGKRSIQESFRYAGEILSEPGNVLLFYPQGNLESMSIRHIKFQEGLREIIPHIKGDCQLIWSSNLIEYFESMKPSVYFNMLDCGTAATFDFDRLKEGVNVHHRSSMEKNIRFTEEPITNKTTS